MISNTEIDYVKKLKAWSKACRDGMKAQEDSRLGQLLRKAMPSVVAESLQMFDSLDYLIAIIEREHTTQSVKRLVNLSSKEPVK